MAAIDLLQPSNSTPSTSKCTWAEMSNILSHHSAIALKNYITVFHLLHDKSDFCCVCLFQWDNLLLCSPVFLFTNSIKEAVTFINAIDVNKFSRLISRIIQKLHLQVKPIVQDCLCQGRSLWSPLRLFAAVPQGRGQRERCLLNDLLQIISHSLL